MRRNPKIEPLLWHTWLLSIVLVLVLLGCRSPVNPKLINESRLDRIKRTGVLRVGYGGYPPYLTKGTRSGEVSGLSVDMINKIIELWNRDIRIEWVETSWDRVKVDFLQDKFDVVVEPLFRTIPRASELNFTRPYTYSGYGIAIVRLHDDRFKKVDDFNRPDITVAVTQSVSSHDFVLRTLPKVKLRVLPTGNLQQPMTEVAIGQVDAAFVDLPSATRFLKMEGTRVKALFYDNPPVLVGAGFMIPQDDYKWASFLNVSIDFLESSGELRNLSKKYGVPYYETFLHRLDFSQ